MNTSAKPTFKYHYYNKNRKKVPEKPDDDIRKYKQAS